MVERRVGSCAESIEDGTFSCAICDCAVAFPAVVAEPVQERLDEVLFPNVLRYGIFSVENAGKLVSLTCILVITDSVIRAIELPVADTSLLSYVTHVPPLTDSRNVLC